MRGSELSRPGLRFDRAGLSPEISSATDASSYVDVDARTGRVIGRFAFESGPVRHDRGTGGPSSNGVCLTLARQKRTIRG